MRDSADDLSCDTGQRLFRQHTTGSTGMPLGFYRDAHSLGASLAADLVFSALRRAIQSRHPNGRHLLDHSDRGCQYTSDAYQHILGTLGITCSVSRTGCCHDNAVAEAFFWSLKREWTNHESYADLLEAELAVFKYIETSYNPRRVRQVLD